jgi:2-phosphoglycerate kinase
VPGNPGAPAIRRFQGTLVKTIVINKKDNTRTPFLRGILIRSLLDASLPFKEAYALASGIRDELSDMSEITSQDLKVRVGAWLEKDGQENALELYQSPAAAPARILVESLNGAQAAFSRGKHERYLQASGLKADKSERTTELIYDQLLAAGVSHLSTGQLGALTFQCLQQEVSKKAAERYKVWFEFQRTSRPLLLLINGAVGTGKSTIATEVAHLLDIVRIQSTDMLREVMRMMIPERLSPVLHCSSFNAWKALPIRDVKDRGRDQLIADGYRSQAELLAVACEAAMQRAVEEGVPMILEGVHAYPELGERAPQKGGAIIVQVTLAVLRPKELKARLRGRGALVPQRRAKRYLAKFESIWSLQSFLMSEADRCDVPIIPNQDKDTAVLQVILQVIQELSQHFDGDPESVFGAAAHDMLGNGPNPPWQDLVAGLAG